MKESKYLPPNSIVLPGKEVFNIFFEGTQFQDVKKDGKIVKSDLRSNWINIQGYFENTLLDIGDLQGGER